MKRLPIITMILAGSVPVASPVFANPELDRAYRPGSISPPDLDDSPNNATTVAVNEGRASYSVPLETPPGFDGVEPELSLNYLGNHSETILGTGWALSVPVIRTQTSGRGGQPSFGVSARYLGLGGEELVEVALTLPDVDGDGVREALYREELDMLRIRYVELSSGGWRVDYPDGRKLTLGTTADTRIAREGNADHIVQWLPEALVDTSGNEMIWVWSSPDEVGVRNSTTAKADIPRYLTEMRWGCQSCATADTYQLVTFDYDPLDAHVLDFSPGFLIEWEFFIAGIEIFTMIDGDEFPVREYNLAYDTSDTRRLLTGVRAYGSDGNFLPWQTFRYTGRDAPTSPTTIPTPPSRRFAAGVQAIDVDLDGRPDVADLGDVGLGATFYRNQPGAGAAFDGAVGVSSPGTSLFPSGTTSADDATRNIAIDVFDLHNQRLYRHDGVGGWDGAGEAAILPAAIASTDTARFDVNADGYPDLIDTGEDPWVFWLDDSALSFIDDEVELSADATPAIGAALSVSGQGLLFGQLNADGLVDAVYIDGSGDTAAAFYGRGVDGFGWLPEDERDDGSPYSTLVIDSIGDPPSRSETVLADVDGDGLGDLVSFDSGAGRLRVWQRVPGSGFVEAPTGSPFVQTIPADRGCRAADWDADSVTEILCSEDWTLYDWADATPFLLEEVDNGLGSITRITYTTTARVAADHEVAGHPWTRNVSMAMPIVARLETDDSRGNVLVTTYDYRNARLETDEVEDRFAFAGFEYVSTERAAYIETVPGQSATRVEDAQDPGVVVRTHYDTGETDFFRRGVALCEETYARGEEPSSFDCDPTGGGALLRVLQSYSTSMDAGGITTRTLDSVERHFIEGGDFADRLWTREEYSYDVFGNRTEVRRLGTAAADDQSMTVTDYVHNYPQWIVQRPRLVEEGEIVVTAGSTTFVPTQRTCYEYDGVTGMCAPGYAGGADHSASRGLRTAAYRATDSDLRDGLSNAQAMTEQVEYDDHGQPVSIVDASGVETVVGYDDDFGLFESSRTVDPSGLALTTTQIVDPTHGGVEEVIGPDGRSTRAQYDSLGRMTALARPGDPITLPTTAYAYAMASPVSFVTETNRDGTGDGLTTIRHLDGAGRVVCEAKEAVSGLDIVAQREFTGRGLVALEYLPFNAAGCDVPSVSAAGRASAVPHDANRYDALGRPTRTTHEPDGSFTETTYGPLERTMSDEEDTNSNSPHSGTPTHVVQDGLGRVTRVVEELDDDGDDILESYTTVYAYDAGGLSTVIDPLGATIYSARYDARERVVWSEAADRGEQTFTYDNADRISSSVDARGHSVSYVYDAAGRVASVEADDGAASEWTMYTYDVHPDGYTTACNTAGRLAHVTDASGATTFCYDRRGRTVGEASTIDAYSTTELVTQRTFDKADRLDTLTHPDGTVLRYVYDAGGRAKRLFVRSNGVDFGIVNDARYNAAGEPERIEYGNGVVVELEYDTRQRHTGTRTRGSGTGVLDLGLSLDGTGNVTAIEDDVGARSGAFAYDDWGRLVQAGGDFLAGDVLTYAYDARGNQVSRHSTEPGSPLTILGFEYDDASAIHALTGIDRDGDGTTDESFDYDAVGNLTEDGQHGFAFDAHGMLRSVAELGSTELVDYTYDYLQRRVAAEFATGDAVFHVRPAAAEIRVIGGQQVMRKHLTFAGRTIGVLDDAFVAGTQADHLFLFASDHLDQPLVVFDVSASANVVERWAGLPFGGENSGALDEEGTGGDYRAPTDPTTVLTRRFQGREIDAGLPELYDFGARVYRSDLGRFMSADNVVPELTDAQAWNRYAFARNNPLSRIDPSGHADMPTEPPPAPPRCTPENPTGSTVRVPDYLRPPIENYDIGPWEGPSARAYDRNDPAMHGRSPQEQFDHDVAGFKAIKSGIATPIGVLIGGPEQAHNPFLRLSDAGLSHAARTKPLAPAGPSRSNSPSWQPSPVAPPARNPVPPLSAPAPARPPLPGNGATPAPSLGPQWNVPLGGGSPAAPPVVTRVLPSQQ